MQPLTHFATLLLLTLRISLASGGERTIIRIGHFPNITHAQALVAHHLSRQGKGWFEERLGPQVEVRWFLYNAGPSGMEAMFANSLDLAFVGPNPAINAHLRSRGSEVRVVAGACSGGAALVVQPDERIQKDNDFKGRKVGTPQFGNTQDVAARAFFQAKGFRVTMTGGDVTIIPTSNPDQLVLFQKGQLDALWTVEPWVSRLVLEAGGKLYLEESTLWTTTGGKYATTLLISSARFLKDREALLRKCIAAHVELTRWISDHAAEAKRMVNEEIQKETTHSLPLPVLEAAWKRLELTYDPIPDSLLKSAEDAFRVGLVKEKPDLTRIHALKLLNEVLREKQLTEVH
jgi:NitT/TauT family transport system substrate-binding protein